MAVDRDSCYSEMTVSESTIVLFGPPAAWGRGNETCLKFSDINRSFFQFLAARTILTNFVTLLHGNSVKVAVKIQNMLYYCCTICNTHTHVGFLKEE